jgi:hypothetical protein
MPEKANLTLPVGTQVVVAAAVRGSTGATVCQRAAVGVVVDAPVDGSQRYRVRLANGVEVKLRREGLRVRKHLQRAGLHEQEAVQCDSEL